MKSSLKEKLGLDPKMKICAICKASPVQWHHVWIYAGKQIQEEWAILPACLKHHNEATPHKNGYKPEIREKFEYLSLFYGLELAQRDYPKTDWQQKFDYLESKYERK